MSKISSYDRCYGSAHLVSIGHIDMRTLPI